LGDNGPDDPRTALGWRDIATTATMIATIVTTAIAA
jgi:hypothetical protein